METSADDIMRITELYEEFITKNIDRLRETNYEDIFSKYKNEMGDILTEDTHNCKKKLKLFLECKITQSSLSYNIESREITTEEQHKLNLMYQAGDILPSSIFKAIIKQLQYQKLLENKNVTIQIYILENLWNLTGNDKYYRNDDLSWKELFELSVYLYNISEFFANVKVDNETIKLIKAAKYFKQLDINHEIKGGRINLSENAHTKIHNRLEQQIKRLGGIECLKRLFNKELQPMYKGELDRYLIHRNKSISGISIKGSRVPYNYLINICGKYLNDGNLIITQSGQEITYQKIIDESSKYLDILQLQGSSIYEDLLVKIDSLPKYIYENMIFENLYIPTQYKPEFVLDMLVKIYKPLYDEMKIKQFTFNDYYKVTKAILQNYNYCSTITFSNLRTNLKIKSKILRIILDVISEDQDEINSNFTQILMPTNLYHKPLVRLSEDSYFLISPHFCSYSFCSVIDQILKAYLPNLNRRIGELTEDYVKTKLMEKHFNFKSGYYSIKNEKEKGECDVVLETKKDIVFIEIKKRSLPKEFELGDDVEVLRSLGDGMLSAQKQIFRHFNYIKHNNTMKLYKEENESSPFTEIELRGRRILSVSMCLPEYGFLTNKLISSKLMDSLIIAKFTTVDPAKNEKLDKLNKLSNKIAQLATSIKSEHTKDTHSIFFNTLFRSIQQFVYVLEFSSSIEQLVEHLTKERYLMDGNLDFYSSLHSYIKIRA